MKKWAAAALAAVFALGAVAPAFADRDDHGKRNRGNHYGWSHRNAQCNSYNNRRNHRNNDDDDDNDGDDNRRYNNGGYNNGGYNNGGYYNGGYNNGGYYNGGYNNGCCYSNGGYNNGGYNNSNCYNGGQYGQYGGNARIFGTIVFVDGNHVVLQTGSRRIDVNDQPALDNQTSGRVSVGRSLTAYGYWQGNIFYATRMV